MSNLSKNTDQPVGNLLPPSPRNRAGAIAASTLAASILFAGLLPPLHAHLSSQPDAERQHLAPIDRAGAATPKKNDKPAGRLYRQWTSSTTGITPIAATILYFDILPANGTEQAKETAQRIAPVAQIEVTGSGEAPAKPAAADATAAPEASAIGEARALAESWARAWSERDVEHYLGTYGKGFTPDNGVSREAWEQSRRQKIEGRKSISVSIRDLKVDADGENRLEVRFLQDYAADNFRETGTPKRLVLAREEGAWRIIGETTDSAQVTRK